jgi:excisionase family DNA binding protein
MEKIGLLLLTSRQAAEALAISERKLWDLAKRGDIPVVRIGCSVRYAPADLQAWIELNTKRAGVAASTGARHGLQGRLLGRKGLRR